MLKSPVRYIKCGGYICIYKAGLSEEASQGNIGSIVREMDLELV